MNERTTTRSTHIILYDARRENFSRLRRKESREEILEKKNGTRCEYRSSERGGVSTAIRCVFALKIRFFFFPSLVAFSLVKFFLSLFLSSSVVVISGWWSSLCSLMLRLEERRVSSSFRGLGKEKKNIYGGGGFHLREKKRKRWAKKAISFAQPNRRTNSLRSHPHFLSLSLNLFLKTTNRLSSPPRWWRNRAKPWSLASLSRWLEYASKVY